MTTSQYSSDLDANPANYTPLSPLTFLERAATVYPEHTALIYGDLRRLAMRGERHRNDAFERTRGLQSVAPRTRRPAP